MQYHSVALPLMALVGGSLAHPGWGAGPACASNACLAAVTGSGALGDAGLRGTHCASFLATTVTPPAVTVTQTITGIAGKDGWKRAQVTVCPNEVPNYASACDEAAYTSACSCFGFTDVLTTTIAPTTTTKTVYVAPTGGWGPPAAGSCTTVVSGTTCPAATATVTVTTTVGGGGYSGPTGTGTGGHGGYTPPSQCVVDDAKATAIVNNFITLLEYTSYPGDNATHIPPGRGYKQDVSNATLAPDFVDISDSINFMAGFPLGTITFPSKIAFDIGQGQKQPEISATTLNIWHDCNSITWRYRLLANPAALPVTGINYMQINSAGLIQKNYAEFDNAAWLQSFGQSCAISPVSVSPDPPALRRRLY